VKCVDSDEFNVLFTVHRDTAVQYERTGCTIYLQFISTINLYVFRACLLLIIRRYYSVYTAIGICQRFSNSFQVGTTFISQNVLRTTLLLGLSNSLGLP